MMFVYCIAVSCLHCKIVDYFNLICISHYDNIEYFSSSYHAGVIS